MVVLAATVADATKLFFIGKAVKKIQKAVSSETAFFLPIFAKMEGNPFRPLKCPPFGAK